MSPAGQRPEYLVSRQGRSLLRSGAGAGGGGATLPLSSDILGPFEPFLCVFDPCIHDCHASSPDKPPVSGHHALLPSGPLELPHSCVC